MRPIIPSYEAASLLVEHPLTLDGFVLINRFKTSEIVCARVSIVQCRICCCVGFLKFMIGRGLSVVEAYSQQLWFIYFPPQYIKVRT